MAQVTSIDSKAPTVEANNQFSVINLNGNQSEAKSESKVKVN